MLLLPERVLVPEQVGHRVNDVLPGHHNLLMLHIVHLALPELRMDMSTLSFKLSSRAVGDIKEIADDLFIKGLGDGISARVRLSSS